MSRPPVHRDLLPLLAMAVRVVVTQAPGRVWTGTADALLASVNAQASNDCRQRPSWPETGGMLASALERSTLHLRARGLRYHRSALGGRPITLRRDGG